ncbi:hypothetical protein SS1G_10287 [Sclerotinia sclerotiorum 1980 UF-70]|uniref:Kinetochore protein mis13 n=1 Tax=Sclerotinia sclerotiorum (strain ATCC 18683 / 1980 / Ss-1) TaxID=665079 RepID=A7EY72_SCLS1|nr:hypothetical protein SS1G_10287 [Sclerotinia sclerotiorum 1980 UF-70]EDN94414.1 hypothetical protein SS1G_10287 [Sclerotinia sclerotiorum 1980 UF-70]
MTTLVRARNPLESLRMNQQPAGRRRSKRLAGYEEEDGDFQFTRISKKAKTTASVPDPIPEAVQPVTTTVPRRTKKVVHERETHGVTSASSPPVKKTRGAPKTNLSTPKESRVEKVQKPRSEVEPKRGTRKSQRRSSLGMRGRRASSLIDSGYSAIPHKEVETSQFYKHIEDGLPEPRRMKQLLTWTGERALPEKPAHGDPDSGAKLAARAISEALLKDFGTNSTFSNWFDREEKQPTRITKVVKKPNPKNIEAEENIQALEARVKQLEIEKAQWISFKKPPAPLPPLFPNTDADTNPLSPSQIDATLLDPEQSDILSLINSSPSLSLRENVSERLKTIHQEIEGKVDRFVDGIHKIERYGETVGRVADKILALSAVRLDERERRERELVGTRDVPMVEVLRSLSRILPEGSAR